ncbi:hypothetical protein BGZ95_000387 [Linnemannia exigua]|uniref:F-box domain-containing protein n=1 Tax=Linnemannia exigua TaxID=604196 RepID=A0AAD4HB17_9FUNG|nr:hypothetical protein BGZ95_000387 [Linnemannia exigua]
MTFTIARLSTLATLPTEIFENIILLLSQHDLTQCVRVSRAWNEAFTPHLWRIIPLFGRTRFKRFMLPDTQGELYKNTAHVREIQVKHEKLYNLFLPSRRLSEAILSDAEPALSDNAFTIGPFTNLRVLELHHRPLARAYEFDEGIFEIVRQNPGLRRLKIGVEMEPEVLLSLVTEHVPNLQELDIETPWRGDVKALLDNLPDSLRTVRLKDVNHEIPWKGYVSSTSSATKRRPLQHHALESLHIGGNLAGQEEQVLVPFLEGCNQNLKTFLGTTRVICFGANWTHIDLFNRCVGPLTAAAIVNNCERLEVLDIMESGTWGLSGSHLQTILTKAPRLRSLQVRWLLGTEKISSVDILSSEWATTSLEHVDLKIHVPRITADQEDADDDDSKALRASSRDIQRQVLRRFGQQTHLRKLVIGGMAYSSATGEFGHQLECLEMTLESGLNELKGLKELEHLDIHDMDHRVGVPELEWMVANFPKLKHLHGMHCSLRPPNEGVQEWLHSHQPKWSCVCVFTGSVL